MIVLALDLSTTATGLVRIGSGPDGVHHDELGALKHGDGWVVRTERLIAPKSAVVEERIDAIIEAILHHTEADLVALESIAGGGVFRSTSMIGISKLHGVVERVFRREVPIPLITVAPATWRKSLLGKGNIRKEFVAVEIWKRYGYEHASLDVIEAFAVGLHALRVRQGRVAPAPIPRTRRAASS